jgi:hypothetical protein
LFELTIVILIYLIFSTATHILKIVLQVIVNEPKFAIKAFSLSLVFSILGYIIKGYVSIKIVLFGVAGFLFYLLYLLVIED